MLIHVSNRPDISLFHMSTLAGTDVSCEISEAEREKKLIRYTHTHTHTPVEAAGNTGLATLTSSVSVTADSAMLT